MKIGDKAIAIEGCAGREFSYGIGDEANPATHIEVTEANIDHLTKLEAAGLVRVLPGEEDLQSEEPTPEPPEVADEEVTEAKEDEKPGPEKSSKKGSKKKTK